MRLISRTAQIQNALYAHLCISREPWGVGVICTVNTRSDLIKVVPMLAQNAMIKPIEMSHGFAALDGIDDVMTKGIAKRTFLSFQC